VTVDAIKLDTEEIYILPKPFTVDVRFGRTTIGVPFWVNDVVEIAPSVDIYPEFSILYEAYTVDLIPIVPVVRVSKSAKSFEYGKISWILQTLEVTGFERTVIYPVTVLLVVPSMNEPDAVVIVAVSPYGAYNVIVDENNEGVSIKLLDIRDVRDILLYCGF
jgi:hypothetical protein